MTRGWIGSLLLVASLGVVAAPALAQRAPYLQLGTSDSMIVRWYTGAQSDSVVCYGDTPDALVLQASGAAGVRDHTVSIDGLEPATRYHYAVQDGGSCPPAAAGDPADYFETAPPIGDEGPVTLWAVGDSGTGSSRQRAVFDAFLSETGGQSPDLFLHMGDMAYGDGTTQEFTDNFFGVYAPVLRNTVTWPTMGNHEGHSSNSGPQTGPYYDAYTLPAGAEAGGMASGTEAYYSFDYANIHFVILDSHDSSRDVDGLMLRWLSDDLAATDQRWIIAYWHHPAYTDGSHDSDSEGQLIDMRENALPILEAAGVDLVMGGHSHIYERSFLVHGAYDTPTTAAGHVIDSGDGRADGDGAYAAAGDGAVYVTAGHGGAGPGGDGDHPIMFFSEVENGSCIIDVAGGSLTLRNIRSDGVETDRVTLVDGDGIFVLAPVGGETLLAGSDVDVLWSSTGGSGQVRVEYSLDDGVTWTTIEESTTDDGHLSWTSPRRATTLGRVRVTDVADASLMGESARPFSLSAETERPFIERGAIWEYSADGSDPGAGWNTSAGGWLEGPAQLGYGDDDEATVLEDADPNHTTAYFRRTVMVDAEVTGAELEVLFDDGFVAFVNGVEVLSRNIGSRAHGDYADSPSGDDEVVREAIDASAFVPGENVIAVLVKQASAGSSDLSFDLSMTLSIRVMLDPDPPDAGPPAEDDAGPRPDSASADLDSGVDSDAGATPVDEAGCGCRAVGSRRAGGAWPLMLLGALLLRRRR